jgi:outer membrane lipoprotein-sorting protein
MMKKYLLIISLSAFVILCGCMSEYDKYTNEVSSYKGTVHYTDDVSKYTARQVLNYFDNLAETNHYDVFMDKAEGGGYEIRVVTIYETKDDLSELKKMAFDYAASDLSDKLGSRVILKAINAEGDVLYTTAG